MRNRTVLLDDLWGPQARELRERLQAAAAVIAVRSPNTHGEQAALPASEPRAEPAIEAA